MKKTLAAALLLCLIIPGLPTGLSAQNDQLSLEQIWLSPAYFPQFPSEFRWMQDDQYYSTLEDEKIIRHHILEEEEDVTLLDLTQLDLGPFEASSIESYAFSADEAKVLLKAEVESIYRRSTREFVFVVDLDTKTALPLQSLEKVSYATFSPDGSKVGYLHQNNLYYHDLASDQKVQFTADGKDDAIINGGTDWVYEEEFVITKAFFWSPDSRRIAFLRFDEQEVPLYTLPYYGQLYPFQYEYKYPKAGEKNSVVTVHLYDLAARSTQQAKLGEETDVYYPRLRWMSAEELAVLRLNRLQNRCELLAVDANTAEARAVLTETSDTYIEVSETSWGLEKWYFLEESDDFLWLSEQDGYYHLYRYTREGELVKQLTEGEFEVSNLVKVDEARDRIYYRSTEDSPLERHLYSCTLEGKKHKKLTKEEGVHEITFSSAGSYFVDTYSSTKEPGVTQLRDFKGKVQRTLVDNKPLKKRLAQLAITPPEFFSFETAEDVELNAYLIKPADFDPSKKYPVLMTVYGGPGSQEVLKQWGYFNYLWHQMLAQEGYLVMCVDNRGTGGRGRAFRTVTYADLGKYETIDQVAGAKYLQSLDYVDPDRIGIWGWSYGGYMTSLCLTKGQGIFKAGIAVAPVTNWRFYDTIYTERYLKTPQENPEGYDQNSPLNFARDLEGSYLLVHGTGDDNVHVQNSMEWTNALVNANKQFEQMLYPNRDHSIRGGYTRFHLYTKMTAFLRENL